MIEGGLTFIAIAVAFAWPSLGSGWFARLERVSAKLSRRPLWSIAAVGASAILIRLAILPIVPIPRRIIPDEFSYWLAADTFSLGRLTNPTPAMWVHFESIHIDMKPTYMSMYFPAQGLVLAAGKLAFGHPWFGQLIVTGLMCSAICWMLQGWLPPGWALLGGLIAVLRLGVFSYWINTYTGAGSIAALGGALVLGALPRLMRHVRIRDGLLLALGVVVLATSRPYEGLLLCLPVAVALGRWMCVGKARPTPVVLMRRAALPLALILAAGSWMAYYDYRVNGATLTLPYTINRATYAVAPYWIWQSPRPEPIYRHSVLRDFYLQNELPDAEKTLSPGGFVPSTLAKAVNGILFFAGSALLPALIMTRRVFIDRRLRFLIVCLFVLAVGMMIETFMLTYYLAPFTAAFYAIGLQAMRHLRQWKVREQAVGAAMLRFMLTIVLVVAAIQIVGGLVHRAPTDLPRGAWSCGSAVPSHCGTDRAGIESRLEKLPGQQLAIVRYGPNHFLMNEWVYNAADIDESKVIWAREMKQAENVELINYYKDRKVWLVQPDLQPVAVSPYPVTEQITGSRR